MERIKTFLYAVIGGMCISFGGVAYLAVDNFIYGSLLFFIGLFTIITQGFALFTGRVCYIFENKPGYLLDTVIVWFGNLAGCLLVAYLVSLTRMNVISERAEAISHVKLEDSLWSIFILAIFCNMLIYFAVEGFKSNPHELGKYLSLAFGVLVFIASGYEHSIANMFFLSMGKMWSGEAAIFIIVTTLGNSVGGFAIPLFKKLTNGVERK